MIQGLVGAALKEVLAGITDSFPKPPIDGQINLSMTLTVKDGKLGLKEGTDVHIDAKLRLGDDDM